MPSKKPLAIILVFVIVALTIVDYQLYHPGILPGATFDYQFDPSLVPKISVPKITSVAQKTLKESSIASSSTVGIYGSDPILGTPQLLEMIDWSANGAIVPGRSANSSRLYLKNEGTTPLVLTFSVSNWRFEDVQGVSLPESCSSFFALSWDYDGSIINAGETRPIIFSLLISPSINGVSRFSFDLVVTAIG